MRVLGYFGSLLKWLGRTLVRIASFKSGNLDASTGIADPNAGEYLFKPKPPEYRP
ncbi:MAG: hypothetical protein H7288_00860 [Kineosporiaceae bacterium]|nr:hypothetical protein [Aeromicrobium sp.]